MSKVSDSRHCVDTVRRTPVGNHHDSRIKKTEYILKFILWSWSRYILPWRIIHRCSAPPPPPPPLATLQGWLKINHPRLLLLLLLLLPLLLLLLPGTDCSSIPVLEMGPTPLDVRSTVQRLPTNEHGLIAQLHRQTGRNWIA